MATIVVNSRKTAGGVNIPIGDPIPAGDYSVHFTVTLNTLPAYSKLLGIRGSALPASSYPAHTDPDWVATNTVLAQLDAENFPGDPSKWKVDFTNPGGWRTPANRQERFFPRVEVTDDIWGSVNVQWAGS